MKEYNLMKSSYRILKLRSGEDIIGAIRGKSKGKFVIERPMVFETVIVSNAFGGSKEITTLNNWIGFSDDITVKIPEDYVITFLTPSLSTSTLYDLEKEREDTGGSERKVKGTPNVEDSMNPEGLLNLFKSLAESEETPVLPFDESPIDVPEEDIPEDMPKDFVAMTLIFPPDILLTLAENGLIDPNMLEDMLNSGKIKFNDKRDEEDYGMDWRDWSPYPEDYINEDLSDEEE